MSNNYRVRRNWDYVWWMCTSSTIREPKYFKIKDIAFTVSMTDHPKGYISIISSRNEYEKLCVKSSEGYTSPSRYSALFYNLRGRVTRLNSFEGLRTDIIFTQWKINLHPSKYNIYHGWPNFGVFPKTSLTRENKFKLKNIEYTIAGHYLDDPVKLKLLSENLQKEIAIKLEKKQKHIDNSVIKILADKAAVNLEELACALYPFCIRFGMKVFYHEKLD